jgi:hypothetical protein
MNEVTTRQSTAVAPLSDDPFADFAQETGSRNIVGQLLKFSKGDWLVGQENDEVPIGSTFVANMFELLRGWVRWEDNKPTDHIMGKVFQRFQPPRRGELGDLDKSLWEVDSQNRERDPWQETYYLLLRDTPQDGEELYTFSASSKGGRDAISDLCRDYSKEKRKQKDGDSVLPIVKIGVEAYDHPNKEYGRIKKPTFEIVGWVPRTIFDDVPVDEHDPVTGEVIDKDKLPEPETAAAAKPAAAAKEAAKTDTTKADTTKTDPAPKTAAAAGNKKSRF